MAQRHLIDLSDLSLQELDAIISLAVKIMENPQDYDQVMKGRIMATLFYEPSTRTQLSFQTAMLRLGGQVIGFSNPENSSVSKGETLKDTIRIVSGYSDLIVLRHPLEGAAKAASLYSGCPILNAGDGGHLHPTQTLTDLVTLVQEKKTLSGLTIGLCGDLKNGRTVHSLVKAMCRYPGNRFLFISTPQLRMPQYVKDLLDTLNCPYRELDSLEEAIAGLDVLYMTRIQKERFTSEEEYLAQKDVYTLTLDKLEKAKYDLKILHPLPRVDEIADEVDGDSRAVYFKQAIYGMYARMALIATLFSSGLRQGAPAGELHAHCKNPRCISASERYLPALFHESGGMIECAYCSQRELI